VTTEKTTLINKDSAVSIGVVISMLAVAVWTSTYQQTIRNELLNNKQEIVQLNEKIVGLTTVVKAHEAKGIDGYPHPEGIIAAINQIKEGQADRWKRADDFLYMKEFCVLNSLKMVPHITLQEAAGGNSAKTGKEEKK